VKDFIQQKFLTVPTNYCDWVKMKIRSKSLVFAMSISLLVPASLITTSAVAATTTLTIDSWRTDDAKIWKDILIPIYEKANPNVKLVFAPSPSNEYDSALSLRMKSKTAADIVMCRPYGLTKALIKDKHLTPITGLPGLQNFTKQSQQSWADAKGVPYCMPVASVGAGFYYNKNIFKELKLTVPKTQAEFIGVLEKIKKNGKYTPLVATGLSADSWALDQLGLQLVGPYYWKGDAGGVALDNGTKKVTDPEYVAAFEALASWKPYLPKAFSSVSYSDAEQLFILGRAAIAVDGSWSVKEMAPPGSNVGVFGAPVAKAGDKPYVQVLADFGFGINAASPSQVEAKKLLTWFSTKEFGQALANNLPGFFPLSKEKISIDNKTAQAWLNLRDGAIVTAPIGMDKMNTGTPNWFSVTTNLLNVMMTTKMTGKQAAAELQKSLESWYPPQKKK
jgi:raffinose/stachyose/melibiose transport system substrate-binding protein